MPTYLADILAAHRARAAADGRPLGRLVEQASATPAPRDFAAALQGGGLSCIAEVKRRSPSKGDLDPGLQPDLVAKEYVAGGAACLSVLTDAEFFGGSAGDLVAARQASGLPVLRKDFTVQEADVADARLMGADAVLLIVAALWTTTSWPAAPPWPRSSGWLLWWRCTTRRSWLGRLGRVRSWWGSTSATCAPSQVDHDRACSLAARIPAGVAAVAESGIRDAADARRLAEAGYDAILVGETLVRAGDRVAQLRELVGHPVGTR